MLHGSANLFHIFTVLSKSDKWGIKDENTYKKQRELRNTLIGWLLVMPSLIFMAAFTVWPVFRSIWLSLTKYKLGMSAPEFIGLKNYISLAGSSLFWKVMGNTLFLR